jgi:hypothetical protein
MHFLLAQVKPVIMWRFIVEIKGLVRKFSNFVSSASFCPLSAFVLRRRKFSVAELWLMNRVTRLGEFSPNG